ncbi:MAG: ATP-binding cassette domain-containing protein [Xanthobacteraceae bacterium]
MMAAQQKPPILRVEGLGVRYGALTALAEMSWSVREGEILGIIGPNGAGKSSCFAALTNSVSHAGDVYLAGEAVSSLATNELAKRGVRRTFQQNSFFGELTVLENMLSVLVENHSASLATSVFMPWRQMAIRERGIAIAEAVLERFGIPLTYYDRLPGEIPYGAQRLLSIALAYGEGPRVLLLDEPAAGIGGTDMQHLLDALLDLKRTGTPLVVIEHHMDLIMTIADRIVVIETGRLLAEGTPAEIQANPAVLDAYLGHAE